MKKTMAMYNHRRSQFQNGKVVNVLERWEVRVMCIAEGYAMVRRKRAMPCVVSLKDLEL